MTTAQTLSADEDRQMQLKVKASKRLFQKTTIPEGKGEFHT